MSKIRMLAYLVSGEVHFLTCIWLSPQEVGGARNFLRPLYKGANPIHEMNLPL